MFVKLLRLSEHVFIDQRIGINKIDYVGKSLRILNGCGYSNSRLTRAFISSTERMVNDLENKQEAKTVLPLVRRCLTCGTNKQDFFHHFAKICVILEEKEDKASRRILNYLRGSFHNEQYQNLLLGNC